MFKLISEKSINDALPFDRVLMSVIYESRVITIPLKKLIGVTYNINDIICITDINLLTSKNIVFLNYELLDEIAVKEEFDDFCKLVKDVIYEKNEFFMKVVAKVYWNNNLILTSEVVEKPKVN